MAASKKAEASAASSPSPAAEAGGEQYRVIALKYRPQTFADVVGQRAVVRQLQGEIRDNRVGHAYLFTGPRGVGKTSMARIFAKALNCVKGPTPDPCGVCVHCLGIANDADMDVIEVDAATYTKKEETIELLEGIDRATFNARYKVYIIDEVHMFSTHSFNVLLKRLEEPPPGVVFILATTNPEKIPETVISRCRRLEFDRMDTREIIDRLREICKKENVSLDPTDGDRILEAIALASEGGMRDAQVALDQLISLSEGALTLDAARQLLGFVEGDLLQSLLEGLVRRETAQCLLVVQGLVDKGRDLHRFIKTFSAYLRDAMLLKADAPDELLKVSRANPDGLRRAIANVSMPVLLNFMQQFLDLEERMKGAAPARFLLEFVIIKLTAIHPRFVLDGIEAGKGSSEPNGDGSGGRAAGAAPAGGQTITSPQPPRHHVVSPAPPSVAPARRASAEPQAHAGAAARPAMALREPAAAEATLPDIALEEETRRPAAEIVQVREDSPWQVPDEDAVLAFKKAADSQLPPVCAVMRAATIQFPVRGTMLIVLEAKAGVIRHILDRPEQQYKLRQLAEEHFGGRLNVRLEVAQDLGTDTPEYAEDPAPSREEVEIVPVQARREDAPVSATSESVDYRRALEKFPELRDVVELVRKHCGADPHLFNGQRI